MRKTNETGFCLLRIKRKALKGKKTLKELLLLYYFTKAKKLLTDTGKGNHLFGIEKRSIVRQFRRPKDLKKLNDLKERKTIKVVT